MMQSSNHSQYFDLFEVMKIGSSYLIEDLAKHPPFDPSKAYERKNDYFDRANEHGLELMWKQLPAFPEIYYQKLLGIILNHERVNNVRFNKGMIYANLGISQIRNGKFSVGIAHLLTAEDEDKEVNPPNYNILNESLWIQFELQIIYPFLYKLNLDKNTQLSFTITETFLNEFFKNLNRDDRIFIQGTLWDLITHLNQAKNTRINSYTLGQLFSGLKDLCLVTEKLLRKNYPTAGDKLSAYLKVAAKLVPANYHSNSLHDFLNNIESNQSEPDVVQRRLRILHCVRNFIGHHFDIENSIKSSTGKTFFFELYDVALTHVLVSMLYLKDTRAI
jgi:hypothetical protein